MTHSTIQRRLNHEVAYASFTTTNVTVSAGTVIPFASMTDLVGGSASSYSFSSGVITLPSGYWYMIKGQVQVRFASQLGYIKYIWQDDADDSDLGRRGTLIMQEQPQLFGGDEIAMALIDCTSAAKDVKLVVESLANVTNLNTSTDAAFAGGVRAELWRI